MRRRHAIGFAILLLAGCAERVAPVFEPLDFDYLTKIKLDVASVDIDDGWVPSGGAQQVGHLAPTRPTVALRNMAATRLLPGGSQGRAVFTIEDASIIRQRGTYVGRFAVRLDLFTADNQPNGTVSAQVDGRRPVSDDDDISVRTDLDALVTRMMGGMNVEFEFQLRQALKAQLQTTSPDAPTPGAVETQDLSPPTPQTAPPAPLQPLAPSAPVPLSPPPLSPPPLSSPSMSPPPMTLSPPPSYLSPPIVPPP